MIAIVVIATIVTVSLIVAHVCTAIMVVVFGVGRLAIIRTRGRIVSVIVGRIAAGGLVIIVGESAALRFVSDPPLLVGRILAAVGGSRRTRRRGRRRRRAGGLGVCSH